MSYRTGKSKSAIPELLTGVETIASRSGLTIATFGHAGDGNMHPTVIYDAADPASTAKAREAFADIVSLALALGGSVSGEHGVGILKRDAMVVQLGPVRELHHRIKGALDPAGIMNPGKAI